MGAEGGMASERTTIKLSNTDEPLIGNFKFFPSNLMFYYTLRPILNSTEMKRDEIQRKAEINKLRVWHSRTSCLAVARDGNLIFLTQSSSRFGFKSHGLIWKTIYNWLGWYEAKRTAILRVKISSDNSKEKSEKRTENWDSVDDFWQEIKI